MKGLIRRTVARLMLAVMIFTLMPGRAFAAKSVTVKNPATNETKTFAVYENTGVFVVFSDEWDEGKITAQGPSFDELLAGTHQMSWGTPVCPAYYFIVNDMSLAQKVSVLESQEQKIYIVGGGHTLTRGSGNLSDMIHINGPEDTTVYFYDITLDGNRENMNIASADEAVSGGLLAVDNSKVVMENCKLINNGVNDGFTVNDGTKEFGTGALRIAADNRSGETGTVTMTGCEVSNNSSLGDGAGVFIGTSGTLTLTGTNKIINNVSNNKSGKIGHGIYMSGNASLNISGNLTVKGNQALNETDGRWDSDIRVGNKKINVTGKLTAGDNTVGIDNKTEDMQVFANGYDTTGDASSASGIAAAGSSSAAFFHDTDTGCHVHKTSEGVQFCKESHAETVTYTLKYDANGGTGAPGDQEKSSTEASVSFAVTSITPHRDGHTFLGWADSKDALRPDYTSGSSITVKKEESPKTIYAVWKKNEEEKTVYTLTYNANGGTGAPADQTWETAADSASFIISSTKPTRDGWTFLGWADTAQAAAASYLEGDEVTLKKESPTKTIYAVWQENEKEKYTITYKNGADIVDTETVPKGESTTVHAALTDPDQTFKGWAEEAGGEVVYQPEDTITPTGDMTLYAVWENKTTPGGDGEEKENYPSMEKTVNGSDKIVIKLNDEVTFKLSSNLPDDLMDYVFVDEPVVMSLAHDPELDVQKGSGHYYLVFHDEMTDGLDWDGTIETVKIGTLELEAEDYELAPDADNKGFTLTLDLIALYEKYGSDFQVNTDTAVTPVAVIYKATYTGSTAEDGNANNKAWVDYTNATSSNADEADVYNGKIIVTKYNADKSETLEGAEFELLDADKNAVLDENGDPVTGTTDADGIVTFANLPSGTYYVRETKAPKGYVKKDDPILVVISANENELHVVRNVTCFNTKVPFTGGTGTMLFTVIGLAVMGGAGAAYAVSRKKKRN